MVERIFASSTVVTTNPSVEKDIPKQGLARLFEQFHRAARLVDEARLTAWRPAVYLQPRMALHRAVTLHALGLLIESGDPTGRHH
jgi:hypothetical protein